ncbi:hypothetical protein AMTRI_Chr11g157290 [Amborella trichopoda]
MCMYGLCIWSMEKFMYIVDYEQLIYHICYFFTFPDDGLITEFENFECWNIFSYIYCVYGVYEIWTMVWSIN